MRSPRKRTWFLLLHFPCRLAIMITFSFPSDVMWPKLRWSMATGSDSAWAGNNANLCQCNTIRSWETARCTCARLSRCTLFAIVRDWRIKCLVRTWWIGMFCSLSTVILLADCGVFWTKLVELTQMLEDPYLRSNQVCPWWVLYILKWWCLSPLPA